MHTRNMIGDMTKILEKAFSSLVKSICNYKKIMKHGSILNTDYNITYSCAVVDAE